MSEQPQSDTTPREFPADRFVRTREQQGLTIEQVCRQLNLSKAVVQAIESGDLGYLSDPVFSRGYIRSYAKLLKLDADAMVAGYNHASGNIQTTGTVKAIGTVSTAPGRRQGHPLLRIGSWLFILALIAASIWWWQTQQGFTTAEREPLGSGPFSIETSDGNTVVLPRPDQAAPEIGGIEQGGAPVPDAMVAEEAPSAGINPPPPSPPDEPVAATSERAAAVGPDEPSVVAANAVEVTFSDECWISIREVGGRTLFNGVAQAGQSLAFESDATLAVVIGRADAVQRFSYQGEPIDLATLSKDNIARFSLPL